MKKSKNQKNQKNQKYGNENGNKNKQ